jgi:ferredoxin
MRIHVNRDVCVGAGLCVLTAPLVFDQGEDDGRVTLLTSKPELAEHNAAREATQICPSGAISLSD